MLDLTSFLVTSGRHVNHVRSNHGIHGNFGGFCCAVLGQDVRLRCTFAGTDSGGISSFGDPNRVARTAAWQMLCGILFSSSLAGSVTRL